MIEKNCAHIELKKTKNITHFLLLKAHAHWRLECSFTL